MFRKPHYIALGLVVLLMLTILNLPGPASARLKHAIGGLFLPLFGLAGSSRQLAEKAGDAVIPRGQLLKENEALRRENQELRFRAMQSAEALRENNRLRELLKWRELNSTWNLRFATVIARDPANWWRTLQIDLGSRDGMQTNLPVLSSEGLVGKISSVSYTRSQVVLLGDPDCKAAALVKNDSHDLGVITGSGPLDRSLVSLTYLSKDANVKPGQDVVTSGLGGIFPKGIPIGQIVDTRQIEYGLATEARVKLSADLGALEEVWVLLP